MLRAAGVALLVVGVCIKASGSASADRPEQDPRAKERAHMVQKQIEARGVRDRAVLEAMREVPRHRFVPSSQRAHAYDDRPLPIGEGQTISQPYIVALMTELAHVKPGDVVLEVGTGSGYQAAVLAQMGAKVYSIEIVEPLAKRAKALLDELGYGNRVEVRHGDGYNGWPEHAPFDAVLVTAAPPKVPEPLKQQLKVGGRLVIPVGRHFQSLLRITRTKQGFREESVIPVRFVPMTGKAQQ
jgi:protein-L-isoaspartate(D-aspartate) O-methyltransferase